MKLNKEQRKQDMMWLRNTQLWSLKQIANKYNIKYQSVQKVIGTYSLDINYSKYALKFKEIGTRPDLTNKQFAELIGCSEVTAAFHRKGIRHAIKGGRRKIGSDWEDWASNKLNENGIGNKLMPCGAPFDIMAFDTVKIEVKTAIKNKKPPSSTKTSPSWAFHIGKDKKPNSSDFFFLIIAPTEEVFIIPNNKFPKISDICFCYPTTRPSMFKWGSYHNAYQLIKDYKMLA